MYLIYKLTCKISGKSYIGYTHKSIDDRWKEHLKSSKKKNYKLYKALRKYPDQFWIHETLINKIPTLEEAKKLEILCIFYYDTFIHGYNSTIGGDGSGPCSIETRNKMSKSRIGNIYALGHKHTQKYKDNKSKENSGKNNPFYGKKHSKETKKQWSKIRKGKKLSEETKSKISISVSKTLQGHEVSLETREKISKKLKGNKNYLGYK